jgi:hypothetical protein
MKKIIYALMLSIFLFGCNSDDEKPKTRVVISQEQEPNSQEENTEIVIEYEKSEPVIDEGKEIETITETVTIEIIKEVPIIIEPEPIPEPTPEEKTMIAVLFYDGSLKKLNDDYSIEVIQEADNVVKADDYFLIDHELKKLSDTASIPINPSSKAVFYGANLFYYGIDKKLYMMNLTDKKSIQIYDNIKNYDIALTKTGIVVGFDFFFQDGSFEQGQYWAQDTAIKINKVGSNWQKFIYDFVGKEWVQVGSGYYSDFVKGSALILQDKTIFTRGATLENGVLSEPVFDGALGIFKGGNAFRQFIQPNFDKPIFQAIGAIGNIGYFLNARDGKIYKYDIGNDSIVEWVAIVTGTGNDDIIDSKALFGMVNPVIVGNEIIFFDGTAIFRIDVSTGEKIEMVQATNFKGWSL